MSQWQREPFTFYPTPTYSKHLKDGKVWDHWQWSPSIALAFSQWVTWATWRSGMPRSQGEWTLNRKSQVGRMWKHHMVHGGYGWSIHSWTHWRNLLGMMGKWGRISWFKVLVSRWRQNMWHSCYNNWHSLPISKNWWHSEIFGLRLIYR